MVGKTSTNLELRIPIKRLWSALIDPKILQKALPDHFVKSVEILEGNGFSSGSTRKLTFGTSGSNATYSIEKIEAVDHASYKLITSVIEGESTGTKATVKLSPGKASDSTILNWEMEYEANIAAAPPLEKAKKGSVRTFKAIETYLLSNNSLYN